MNNIIFVVWGFGLIKFEINIFFFSSFFIKSLFNPSPTIAFRFIVNYQCSIKNDTRIFLGFILTTKLYQK